jgi:putative DNA primase/helicase
LQTLLQSAVVAQPPQNKVSLYLGSSEVGSAICAPGAGSQLDVWPDPQPLPGMIEVEPFRSELLPEAYRPWIVDIAERMQCPMDFPAVAAMVTTASVVGRQIGIRPKRLDHWTVVPNLWGAVVARPSLLKSPAIEEPIKMLRQLELEHRKVYQAAMRQYQEKLLIRKASEKLRDQEIVAALNKGNANAVAKQWLDGEEPQPVCRRFKINDATIEMTGVLLNENPRGLLVFRDELVALWRSLNKDSRDGARAFYLEAWNGTGSFTYDRIGRGTLDIKACCLSILGGIQPGPLHSYTRDAVRGGSGDDGLLQRFQLVVWPDVPREWRNVDREPQTKAQQRAWKIYQRLSDLDPKAAGAIIGAKAGEIPYLRFDEKAQAIFNDWRAELETRVRADDESQAFLAHLGKYRSLVPSLALLFQLIDVKGGPVGQAALERAIGWASYLESHSRRVYGGLADPQQNPARAFANRILGGQLAVGFTLREIYQPHWSQLDNRELAAEAAEKLASLDWLRRLEIPTGGRPSVTFKINPKILARAESDNVAKVSKA